MQQREILARPTPKEMGAAMLLHEFMVRYRDEILEVCSRRLRTEVPDALEISRDVELFFDEIVQELRRHEGLPAVCTILPGGSATAARLGKRPQDAGVNPAKIPRIFGAIASAIGYTGERHGLAINADEYNVFQDCIDCGVAIGIENFWNGENAQRQKSINERFGFLAHELRSAVGNAALAFKLLRAGELDLKGRTAGVLTSNLTRMETLIARTLGSVQLDSGMTLELAPLQVASVLRRLQASALPERAISLTLEVDETLHINADEMLLSSALTNVVSNAIKFSHTGGHVALSCRAEHEGVLIEVEDECGGLPPDDPVLSALTGWSNAPAPLGPGLTITKRAVEAMCGRLYVENISGHGCAFGMIFPVAQPRRSSSVPPPPSVPPPASAPPRASTLPLSP